MKILISPAKSIKEDCSYPMINFSTPLFSKEAKSLNMKLKKMKVAHLMGLMHVSKEIAELNAFRYKNWHLSDTPTASVKPAGFLFTGEVYRGLDLTSFSPEMLQLAQDQLRIISGMYGLLKPLDLIYPYRLEMGTKLNVKDGISNLYQYWGTKLTKSLQKELSKDEMVVNLASNEYAKAILFKQLKQQVITPVFKEFKGGEYKIVMMYAKHARGAMARYILQHQPKNVDDLKLFSEGGYQFNENLSTENEWVYVR
jgi:cytoplasmic iron level regulating protein YaaA (DUF328/UPF0246 family)